MKINNAANKRLKNANTYPKFSEIPYINPPKIGPKIEPVCQEIALRATASGSVFLVTIFGSKAEEAGPKNARTILRRLMGKIEI